MPTYEFRCPLGHEFERFYRTIGTSEAQTACPECGQVAGRMMSAGAGLVFKGSGFYITDYAKKSSPESSGSKSSSSEKSDKSSSDKGSGEKSSSEKSDKSSSDSSSSASTPAPAAATTSKD